MRKSIIDFFETGKDCNVHWFTRFQDIFFGIALTAGGIIILSLGVAAVFTDIFVGIGLMLAGVFFISMFLFSRKRGSHPLSSFAGAIVVMSVVAAMLSTNNIFYANVLSIMIPLTCTLSSIKRGCIVSIVALTACLIVGLIFGSYEPVVQIAFFLIGAFVLVISCAFVAITSELISTNDDKVSDIQKNTEIKNELIAQLSYQIRTPLNNIVAIGNLLNETQLNSKQKDMMETVLASASNLVNVINVFSAQVSSPEIPSKINSVSFNLQTLMNSTIQLFVGQSEEYNIGVKPNLDDPYILEGDTVRIKQIFLNLIDAIIKSKKAEKINIIISYRVNQATEQTYEVAYEIKVNDNISFEGEPDWGKAEMINYSISSQLITHMSGGKLTSKYEQGYTILNFTLSLKKSSVDLLKKETEKPLEREEQKETNVSRDISKVDLSEARVLLVEDNLINQKIVVLSIKKLVKDIDIANNGQEALDKFKASKHDIILMDIQMPVMDGIQATKKIREMEIEKRIVPTPIIAITANALAGDREHCLASGMDEYISKPFQVEVLVTKMKNLLAIGSSIK